jgi:acetylglutamate kinase
MSQRYEEKLKMRYFTLKNKSFLLISYFFLSFKRNVVYLHRKKRNSDMKEKITVVKVGGAVVEDERQLAQLLKDFAAIEGRKVLVHGGGRKATKMAERLGIETQMVGGRRITDAGMLEVVTMVYGGLVNKNLVARLQANGVNAIGLTGADGDVIRSHKRPPVVIDGSPVDFGFVGDVDCADGDMLSRLVEAGITPVMAPLTHDGEGNILNTNADTIASETAKALADRYDVTLIFSFEKKGVLSDPDDDDSVIPVITRTLFEQYKANGTISGGMLPKIENALSAVDAGVCRVIITLATAIDGQHGTVIVDR